MNTIQTMLYRLEKLHEQEVTWEDVSKRITELTGIRVPPGTLATIVRKKGKYIPHNRKFQVILGLRQSDKISDWPSELLKWRFENREEM